MKKLTYILVAVLISSLLVGGLVSAQETEMKTYKNEEYGFKVSYPEGWTKTEVKNFATSLVAFSSQNTSFSLVANRLKKELNLAEYVKARDIRLKTFARYEKVEKRKKTISGVTAYIRESTRLRDGKGNTKGKTVYLTQDDILYTLSFNTSEETYAEEEENFFDPILDSFELI